MQVQKKISTSPYKEHFNNIKLKSKALYTACCHNNLEVLKYLLLSGSKDFTRYSLTSSLVIASIEGHTKIIKHLLCDNMTNLHDFSKELSVMLNYACEQDNYEMCKYLLESNEIKQRANHRAKKDEALVIACESGSLEIVKYLTTSKKLQTQCNPRAQKDLPFKSAYTKGHISVIDFFIFDLNIELDKPLLSLIGKNKSLKNKVLEKFTIRDEKYNLNKEIIKKIVKPKKTKTFKL